MRIVGFGGALLWAFVETVEVKRILILLVGKLKFILYLSFFACLECSIFKKILGGEVHLSSCTHHNSFWEGFFTHESIIFRWLPPNAKKRKRRFYFYGLKSVN